MGYVSRRLRAGESVVHRTGFHGITFFSLHGLLTLGIWPWIKRRTTELVITSQRVILKRGWLQVDWQEIPADKVEEVAIGQGLLGRLLDYGSIVMKGSGGGSIELQQVARPHRFNQYLPGRS